MWVCSWSGSTALARLVLADHGENDFAAFQFANEGLEADERLALVELPEHDALETVVANHASPERVVEV